MRISDWSSDVCSSDLHEPGDIVDDVMEPGDDQQPVERAIEEEAEPAAFDDDAARAVDCAADMGIAIAHDHSEQRSEEHTSELQSLMRISYAVFCLKKKNNNHQAHRNIKNRVHLH